MFLVGVHLVVVSTSFMVGCERVCSLAVEALGEVYIANFNGVVSWLWVILILHTVSIEE